MRTFILAAALAGAVTPAFAQYVVIEPEVREYVIREAPAIEYDYDYDGPVEVGAVLPGEIEIFDIDDPDIDVDYGYTVLDDRRVIVEPETRRIVHIVE
jgi:hypothetical protein